MEFKCSNCNYTSETKKSVMRHINKKIKCSTDELKVIEIKVDIKCEFCNKSITTKPNLTKHLKVCKVKKINIEKELILKNEQLKELEKKVEILEAVAKKPNITINTVNLTSYNNPNLRDIEKFFDMCAKKSFMCIPKLVELIHFNESLPENHNLLLTNFRSDIMKAYKGNKWQIVNFNEITDELIGNYERDLEDWAGENPERIKYIDKWNSIKLRDGEEKIYEDLQQELRKIMYDNRTLIKSRAVF